MVSHGGMPLCEQPDNRGMSKIYTVPPIHNTGEAGGMNRAIINFDRITLDNIHQYALDILSDTGIRFPNQKALDIFAERGFKIDGETV